MRIQARLQFGAASGVIFRWLEPPDYEGFSGEIAIHALALKPKHSCDRQMASDVIDEATVLAGPARLELIQRHRLRPRVVMAWHTLH